MAVATKINHVVGKSSSMPKVIVSEALEISTYAVYKRVFNFEGVPKKRKTFNKNFFPLWQTRQRN